MNPRSWLALLISDGLMFAGVVLVSIASGFGALVLGLEVVNLGTTGLGVWAYASY